MCLALDPLHQNHEGVSKESQRSIDLDSLAAWLLHAFIRSSSHRVCLSCIPNHRKKSPICEQRGAIKVHRVAELYNSSG